MTKLTRTAGAAPVPVEGIATRIVLLRGQRVLFDADLAALYEVPTKRLNEQVRRNAARFPADFMFQLVPQEWDAYSGVAHLGDKTKPESLVKGEGAVAQVHGFCVSRDAVSTASTCPKPSPNTAR